MASRFNRWCAIAVLAGLVGCGGGGSGEAGDGGGPTKTGVAIGDTLGDTTGRCDVSRGGSGEPVIAAGHPRILLNHAPTLSCLRHLLGSGVPSAVRFKDMVDLQLQGEDLYDDDGVDVRVGGAPCGDLLILQGPLALNWRRRRWGLVPRIENADVRAAYPPTDDRVDLWVEQHIHVQGRPEWIFVKVHTHGTQDRDIHALLGRPVERMFERLERQYNDGRTHVLHYVTAREMFNIVKAAEAGCGGNPHDYRDFVLPKPPMFSLSRQQGAATSSSPAPASCPRPA
jgi:hypothetical protein